MAYNEDVNVNLNILAGAMGGITAISAGMSALTSTFGQFGTTAVDSFGAVDGLLVTATAGLAVLGVQAASAFGEFEQGMKIVQAVSGQTSGAIQELGNQANQLSVTYRTAIGDITEGLQTLGRAGLNSADAQLEVLENGLQTAKLEGRNLNGVLEELIQNTAMLGGDLDSLNFGDQTKYVNSLMVGTSMSAPIDTHDISQTLQYVGGTAAAAGANLEDKEKLEDLMGTIAAFAQKGVTGSMAGTALRAFLTKPASQDKSVTEGLSSIGLSPDDLWENGGESMKDVSDQIELIQRQMDRLNLSTMDQLEIWGKIVGPKMGQQMMKLEADKIKDLKSDIQSASSAEELATSTLSTYNQKVSEMGQIGSGIFRQFGANVVMWLNPVLEIINKIASVFNNQFGGFLLFTGAIGLISHGIQAARGMISSIVGQIRAAFTEIRGGLANLSGNQDNVIGGASRYDDIIQKAATDIKIMNSNLQETNTLWGRFQALALGKQATGYIKGYNKDKPMDQGLLGVTDNYTQYFRKPQMGPEEYGMYRLRDYDKLSESIRAGIVQGEYDKLSKSDKKFFHYQPESGLYEPRGGGGMGTISTKDYNNMSSHAQSLFLEQKFKFDDARLVEKTDKFKRTYLHAVSDDIILNMDEMYEHISPGKYQSLPPEQKELYKGQNFRIEDRVGSEEEAYRRIAESQENFRLVDEHAWQVATDKEKEFIQQKTREYGEYMADQAKRSMEKIYLKDDKGDFIRDSKGNKVESGQVSYQTYHHVPKPEDMATLKARDKREIADAMVQAQNQANFQKTRETARNQMGRRAKIHFDGLEQLRERSHKTSEALTKLSNIVIGDSNKLNQEGRLVQTNFQKLRSSIGGGIAALGNLGKGFSLSNQQISNLSGKFLTLSSDATALGMQGFTTREMFSQMAGQLGLTEKEFAELVLESQAVENKFRAISGASPEAVGKIASEKFSGKLGKLSGVVGDITNMLGGPFSAALIGVTIAVQAVQAAFQSYQQELQKAQQELSEAKQKRDEFENNIEDIYKSENGEITEADLSRAVNAQYASIGNYQSGSLNDFGSPYVEGDVYYQIPYGEDPKSRLGDETYVDEFTLASEDNIQALNENTIQLAAATYEYAQAADKIARTLTNRSFGQFGGDADPSIGSASYITTDNASMGTRWSDAWGYGTGGNMFKREDLHLLPSQAADDYAGSKELAGIIAADAQRFGAEGGLATVFGVSIDDMRSKLGGIQSNTYKTAMNLVKPFSASNMSAKEAAAAQVSLKEHKEDYQRLGKSLAKREVAMGNIRQGNALMNANLGSGNLRLKGGITNLPKGAQKDAKKQQKTAEQQLKELRAIDKGIANTIAKLIQDSNGILKAEHIISMAQLQQFQDMYNIAQSQIAPGILSTVEQVYSNVLATQGAGSAAGQAANYDGSVAGNTAIIAQFLAQQAIDKAYEMSYNEEKRKNPFIGFFGQDFYEGLVSTNPLGLFTKQQDNIGTTVEATGLRLNNPNMSMEDAMNIGRDMWNDIKNNKDGLYPSKDFASQLNTASGNIKAYAEGATFAAYMNSDIGEGGSNKNASGSGGGGGDGGSGSGGDDSGKNTKNRVDLVLCNKKEIPKLNVNLFKKEPNFTVLNKNFKLRDIKINTKDTPKSILDAVKNGIIDTAKRMDPKIIQDEESVYDPMGATEGTDVPSGSSPTSSD